MGFATKSKSQGGCDLELGVDALATVVGVHAVSEDGVPVPIEYQA